MDERRERKGLTLVVVVLSAAMIILMFLQLSRLLQPEYPSTTNLTSATADPRVSDATLGMVLIDIDDEQTAAYYHVSDYGVYVLAVSEDSQAYLAGVRSGDRIAFVNSVPIEKTDEFSTVQNALVAGDALKLVITRMGTEIIVTLYDGREAAV